MVALAQSPSGSVTWLEVGSCTYYVIARCELCNVVVEREAAEIEDDRVLDSIGLELLGDSGCTHVNHLAGSGLRRAFKRTP